MKEKDIERFFRLLARELDWPAKVILTGAGASVFWGNTRPSVDLDFCLKVKGLQGPGWEKIHAAVKKTSNATGIPANYAEDIDRWGMISLLDYEKTARAHGKYGWLHLYLMDPVYWAIGKLSRYLESDEDDLKIVFKNERPSLSRCIKVWSKAVKKSPHSTSLDQFVRHVDHFLKTHGISIWGKRMKDYSSPWRG